MMMKGIAPGRSRKFAAEDFAFIPKAVWKSAREEAFDLEHPTDFQAYASDIDPAAVMVATKNARLAGVSDTVKVFSMDARKISAPGRRATIVTNPPYGERLGTQKEAERLYSEIGEHFRSLSPWQVYIITSHPSFEKFYGARADKVRKLYNGMLPCYLYQYFKSETRKESERRKGPNPKTSKKRK
jgi:putative N6-adenine-specific DNA methylase